MIYIVTGRHRSGTSMMMRAIALSSPLNPVVDEELEDKIRNANLSEEDGNPYGYFAPHYEVLPHDCKNNDLLKVTVHRWSYKLMEPTLQRLNEFMILRIVRDERERLLSWRKHFDPAPSDKLTPLFEAGEDALANFPHILINYSAVIDNPLQEFQKLKDAGWPIDPAKAVAAVDPKLYRNRV